MHGRKNTKRLEFDCCFLCISVRPSIVKKPLWVFEMNEDITVYSAFETWWHTRRNQISSFAERTSPFKLADDSVQSTAGRRGVRISVSKARYTIFRGSMGVLATPSIRQFPLHFPSHASPCAISFSKALYNWDIFKDFLLTSVPERTVSWWRKDVHWWPHGWPPCSPYFIQPDIQINITKNTWRRTESSDFVLQDHWLFLTFRVTLRVS